MISTGRVSDLFVEVADTLVDEFDLADFLHTVVMHVSEVTGSAAAGLLLADHDGELTPMAASSEEAALLSLFEVQRIEGPSLDSYRTGEEVPDIDVDASTTRWPEFAGRAADLGFRTAHCFPLRLRAQVIGALTVLGDHPGPLRAEERRVARALTDLATIGLMQERALRRAEQVTEQLQYALNSRIVIEQAKGALARTLHTDVEGAFAVLRAHARRHQVALTDLARRVLEDPAALEAVAGESGPLTPGATG
jgi:GAF domain-containing protein